MYTNKHVDPDNPPVPTRHLNRRILCGLCKFKCCKGKSLNVECTPEESKALNLPILFPIDGNCRCLTDNGCKHGDNRPVLCKLFPLQVKETPAGKPPQLIVSHWVTLNCPSADNYELVKQDAVGYHYRRVKVGGAKANNCDEEMTLQQPLEDYPTALQGGQAAVAELYSEDTYKDLVAGLRKLNGDDRKGFGLGAAKEEE